MDHLIRGKAHCFGDHLDTDRIYPGAYLALTDHKEIGAHCLEGADPDFLKKFAPGDIIVAGKNFGCGSSREHAAIALKSAGAGAVIAESFARIFYRNAINLGLPLISTDVSSMEIEPGDELELDLKNSVLTNRSKGLSCRTESVSDYAMSILSAGGVKNLVRKQLEEQSF